MNSPFHRTTTPRIQLIWSHVWTPIRAQYIWHFNHVHTCFTIFLVFLCMITFLYFVSFQFALLFVVLNDNVIKLRQDVRRLIVLPCHWKEEALVKLLVQLGHPGETNQYDVNYKLNDSYLNHQLICSHGWRGSSGRDSSNSLDTPVFMDRWTVVFQPYLLGLIGQENQ